MLDMLNHALFDFCAHGMPVGLQYVLGFVDLSDAHQIVLIPMVEVALTGNRQVRVYTA